MKIDYTFVFWDNLFAITSIVVSAIVAVGVYKLSKQLSAKEKFKHELRVTEEIKKLNIYKGIVLADVRKYHPLRTDGTNQNYYKQSAELYTVIPEYGIQFILMPKDENIPVGLVPFEWIEYIRDFDGEDNKPIIVCKFKGVRYYRRFKSPFKEINHVHRNPNYQEGSDPDFMKFI